MDESFANARRGSPRSKLRGFQENLAPTETPHVLKEKGKPSNKFSSPPPSPPKDLRKSVSFLSAPDLTIGNYSALSAISDSSDDSIIQARSQNIRTKLRQRESNYAAENNTTEMPFSVPKGSSLLKSNKTYDELGISLGDGFDDSLDVSALKEAIKMKRKRKGGKDDRENMSDKGLEMEVQKIGLNVNVDSNITDDSLDENRQNVAKVRVGRSRKSVTFSIDPIVEEVANNESYRKETKSKRQKLIELTDKNMNEITVEPTSPEPDQYRDSISNILGNKKSKVSLEKLKPQVTNAMQKNLSAVELNYSAASDNSELSDISNTSIDNTLPSVKTKVGKLFSQKRKSVNFAIDDVISAMQKSHKNKEVISYQQDEEVTSSPESIEDMQIDATTRSIELKSSIATAKSTKNSSEPETVLSRNTSVDASQADLQYLNDPRELVTEILNESTKNISNKSKASPNRSFVAITPNKSSTDATSNKSVAATLQKSSTSTPRTRNKSDVATPNKSVSNINKSSTATSNKDSAEPLRMSPRLSLRKSALNKFSTERDSSPMQDENLEDMSENDDISDKPERSLMSEEMDLEIFQSKRKLSTQAPSSEKDPVSKKLRFSPRKSSEMTSSRHLNTSTESSTGNSVLDQQRASPKKSAGELRRSPRKSGGDLILGSRSKKSALEPRRSPRKSNEVSFKMSSLSEFSGSPAKQRVSPRKSMNLEEVERGKKATFLREMSMMEIRKSPRKTKTHSESEQTISPNERLSSPEKSVESTGKRKIISPGKVVSGSAKKSKSSLTRKVSDVSALSDTSSVTSDSNMPVLKKSFLPKRRPSVALDFDDVIFEMRKTHKTNQALMEEKENLVSENLLYGNLNAINNSLNLNTSTKEGELDMQGSNSDAEIDPSNDNEMDNEFRISLVASNVSRFRTPQKSKEISDPQISSEHLISHEKSNKSPNLSRTSVLSKSQNPPENLQDLGSAALSQTASSNKSLHSPKSASLNKHSKSSKSVSLSMSPEASRSLNIENSPKEQQSREDIGDLAETLNKTLLDAIPNSHKALFRSSLQTFISSTLINSQLSQSAVEENISHQPESSLNVLNEDATNKDTGTELESESTPVAFVNRSTKPSESGKKDRPTLQTSLHKKSLSNSLSKSTSSSGSPIQLLLQSPSTSKSVSQSPNISRVSSKLKNLNESVLTSSSKNISGNRSASQISKKFTKKGGNEGPSSSLDPKKNCEMTQLTLREFLEKMSKNELPQEKKQNALGDMLKKPEILLKISSPPKSAKPRTPKSKKDSTPKVIKNLPAKMNCSVFKHYLKHKLSKEGSKVVQDMTEIFFKNLSNDLAVILASKNEKVITKHHVYLLMKKLGVVDCWEGLYALMQELLPSNEWKKVVPIQYAFNKVYPKK